MINWGIISLLLILPVNAYATSPKNVELTADIKSNKIHVHAEHVSEILEKHFIRKMVVTINGVALEPFYYHRQASSAGLDVNIAAIIKPNDRIDVELYCSKGGLAKAQLIVPQIKEDSITEK